MPTIGEHMTRDLLTVAAGDGLGDAARRMAGRGVGAVLVMDGDRLQGILTERDMLRAVAGGFREDAKVADWMTHHPETIEANDSTEHAAALMIHGGFRHLPVLEEGRVAGIVSIRDLMRVALQDMSPRGVWLPGLEDLAERVRRLALSLPETYEDEPWGHPVFKVADNRMFAAMSVEADAVYLTVKLTAEEREVAHLLPYVSTARYVGRYGWITAEVADDESLENALEWLRESYWLKAPAKLKSAVEGEI